MRCAGCYRVGLLDGFVFRMSYFSRSVIVCVVNRLMAEDCFLGVMCCVFLRGVGYIIFGLMAG